MIKFIKNWYTVRKTEIALKASLYGAIAAFINERQEITDLIKKMYISLKDVSADELGNELIDRITDLAHEQAVKEHEAE